jgi:penicillin-binding protein 1C
VDPIGIGRALVQNFKNKRIISGGSTLTMQVIRLARRGKPRTIGQKLIEIILATRLELSFSKQEILVFYASNAPFGGNVVGLDAASWRYFGKRPSLLSWAEAAMLAVLPNSPALIHPGRNRANLLAKRNRLLKRLHASGAFDDMMLDLSLAEELPAQPLPIPRLAPHLLVRSHQEHFQKKENHLSRLVTTVDPYIQTQTNKILQKHQALLQANGIYNAAAIIQEVNTGNVIAYVGNMPKAGAAHHEAVDIIKAPRSTGSILKPFLYAAALQDGLIFPNSLIPDIPTQMLGFRPENYHLSYDGVVTAKQALVKSLNIPFVRLLQDFGLENFHFQLKQLGLTSITQSADYYGLPLILGGAEGKLGEITNVYANMARTLNEFYELDGRYDNQGFRPLNYVQKEVVKRSKFDKNIVETAPVLSAASIYQTFEAIQQVERPDSDGNWERFQSSHQIAWKTGTSIGFRDAWAVGVTPKYAVGVWVGNADGEGRPGLIGVHAAGPILFELFDLLPAVEWFVPPYDELKEMEICNQSGFRPLDICPKDTILTVATTSKVKTCSYHHLIHLDQTRQFQVTSNCENPDDMLHKAWFILPAIEAYYYKFRNPNYQNVPPFRTDCPPPMLSSNQLMQLIYPKNGTKIEVPIDINGERSRTVFKVAHQRTSASIYWHLDNHYIGKTELFHEMALNPSKGKHKLTLIDEKGLRLERQFEIVD